MGQPRRTPHRSKADLLNVPNSAGELQLLHCLHRVVTCIGVEDTVSFRAWGLAKKLLAVQVQHPGCVGGRAARNNSDSSRTF